MIINFCGDLHLYENLERPVVGKIRNKVFVSYPTIISLEGPILDNSIECDKIFESGPAISGYTSFPQF